MEINSISQKKEEFSSVMDHEMGIEMDLSEALNYGKKSYGMVTSLPILSPYRDLNRCEALNRNTRALAFFRMGLLCKDNSQLMG